MIDFPEYMILPIKADDAGTIRVSGTRVTLHSLLTLYKLGETPDAIHEAFPSVPLADIYAVIAYYLANRPALDAYLVAEDEASEAVKANWEANRTTEARVRLEALRRLLDEHRADH